MPEVSAQSVFTVVELRDRPYIDSHSRMLLSGSFDFQFKLFRMFLVVAPSPIHALGLYTTRAVARGAAIFQIELNGNGARLSSYQLLNGLNSECVLFHLSSTELFCL